MISNASLANTPPHTTDTQLVAFNHSYSQLPSVMATLSSPAITSHDMSAEEFQVRLNNIAALMEWRANNIGYAFGVQLGHMIGTRACTDDGYSSVQSASYFEEYDTVDMEEGTENEDNIQTNALVIRETTPQQQDNFSSDPNPLHSFWHASINSIDGHFSSMRQRLNSVVQGAVDTTCRTIKNVYERVLIHATEPLQFTFKQMKKYENLKGSILPKPKAIQFVTANDPEGVFAADGHVNRFNEASLYQQGYRLYREPISSAEQICKILFTDYRGKKFDFISIEGHGSTYYVEFSRNMGDNDPKLTAKNIRKQLHCLPQYMHERSKITFRSCSTGAFSKLPYYNKLLEEDLVFTVKDYFQSGIDYLLYGNQDNLATATYRFLSKTNPGIEISAPGLNTYGSYVHSIEPFDVVSPSRLNGQYYANSNLIYNKHSIALIDKLRELSEFDPENSHIAFLDDANLKVEWIKKIQPDIHELKMALKLNMRDKRVQDEYLYGQIYLDANTMILQMMFTYAGQLVLTLSAGLAVNYARKKLRPAKVNKV
ncbi:hypothetical protein CC99x_006115 [Candidatus Berkiella cookevillensis]|uniref:Uncharacterized protein n=1 Tax=Candidatus Berkiella cookevillensis TaxID=437022 RepID=A0A0Q9YH80_9GAMM|nr:hypothetical protein [Candidatus Berkiella cookevillensis]MCS5708480.1 hypothetical protein [Candidatus Berkiella cookevillensis]